MIAEERYRIIREILRRDGVVKVLPLAEQFEVSSETIRRDLDYLEKQGFLRKVYGGAVLDMIDTRLDHFEDRGLKFQHNKKEIAEIACSMMPEGGSIAMDVGTTNLAIARELRQQNKTLTVVTNSLPIVNELADAKGISTVLTGGVVNGLEKSVVGEICLNTFSMFHVDLCFISASGISLSEGITDLGFGEVETKRMLIKIAKRVVTVCNSSRFDMISLLKVCGLAEVDSIVTDSNLSDDTASRYRDAGVKVIRPQDVFSKEGAKP